MTAADETAADLLAAGTENISLAEEFPFLREVIHFSLVSTKSILFLRALNYYSQSEC